MAGIIYRPSRPQPQQQQGPTMSSQMGEQVPAGAAGQSAQGSLYGQGGMGQMAQKAMPAMQGFARHMGMSLQRPMQQQQQYRPQMNYQQMPMQQQGGFNPQMGFNAFRQQMPMQNYQQNYQQPMQSQQSYGIGPSNPWQYMQSMNTGIRGPMPGAQFGYSGG